MDTWVFLPIDLSIRVSGSPCLLPILTKSISHVSRLSYGCNMNLVLYTRPGLTEGVQVLVSGV